MDTIAETCKDCPSWSKSKKGAEFCEISEVGYGGIGFAALVVLTAMALKKRQMAKNEGTEGDADGNFASSENGERSSDFQSENPMQTRGGDVELGRVTGGGLGGGLGGGRAKLPWKDGHKDFCNNTETGETKWEEPVPDSNSQVVQKAEPVVEAEPVTLESFLLNVGFAEYLTMLAENGYGDLCEFKKVDDKTLTELGMKKGGHRKKMLKNLKNLALPELPPPGTGGKLEEVVVEVEVETSPASNSAEPVVEAGEVTLESFLKQMGLIDYLELFAGKGYGDFNDFKKLDDAALTEMGVKKGHRKKIIKHMSK